MAHMAGLISLAFSNGLVSKVSTTRQDGAVLYFTAEGTAPGKPRIRYERSNPEEAVIAVLTDLASLSPKNSPRGDDAITLLGQFGHEAPEREEDPPEPEKEDEAATTATDMKVATE